MLMMCRMIMALGDFSINKIIDAAINMSEGKTATHLCPTYSHPNGWGIVWSNPKNRDNLSIYRNSESISKTIHLLPFNQISTNFLAIHVRHATIATKVGLKFTHPISSINTAVPWYMMHNGFLPTIYKLLNLSDSNFDTREYFDYVIPNKGYQLDQDELLNKLNKLESIGTSANAIIINPYRVYIVHWMMTNLEFADYFTMYTTKTANACYIASEIQPHIAPPAQWHKLSHSSVIEFNLVDEFRS